MTPLCTNQPKTIGKAERCYHMSQAQYLERFCTSHCKWSYSVRLLSVAPKTPKMLRNGWAETDIRLWSTAPHEGSCRDLMTDQNIWRVSTLRASNSLHVFALSAKLFVHSLYRLCSIRSICHAGHSTYVCKLCLGPYEQRSVQFALFGNSHGWSGKVNSL